MDSSLSSVSVQNLRFGFLARTLLGLHGSAVGGGDSVGKRLLWLYIYIYVYV